MGTAAETVEESELARGARTAELRDMRSRRLHLAGYATATHQIILWTRTGDSSMQMGIRVHKLKCINRLSYGRAIHKGLLRGDEPHLAVTLTGHENHTLGLDAPDGARREIGENADLLSDHLLWAVVLSDT